MVVKWVGLKGKDVWARGFAETRYPHYPVPVLKSLHGRMRLLKRKSLGLASNFLRHLFKASGMPRIQRWEVF